ncbi:hypothetical protein [Anaerorhabdus sp.]|jgi:hypothetical protein|uniref:hypothetical protein n=1 Tax=Anaerorhabdus sp. TaxID=1872524 RepID=UPI002FC90B05
MKKICYLIIVLTTSFSIILAINTKNSFVDIVNLDSAMSSNPIVEFSGDDIYEHFFVKVNSLDDLLSNAEFVLRVTPTEFAEQRAYSYIRECNVLDSYKGNTLDQIYIYEPNYFTGLNRYTSGSGYIQMKIGEEYIVFLNNVDRDQKSLNKEFINGYAYVNKGLSKFAISDEPESIKLLQENIEYRFNDISDYEYISFENERIELYIQIKKEIMELVDY